MKRCTSNSLPNYPIQRTSSYNFPLYKYLIKVSKCKGFEFSQLFLRVIISSFNTTQYRIFGNFKFKYNRCIIEKCEGGVKPVHQCLKVYSNSKDETHPAPLKKCRKTDLHECPLPGHAPMLLMARMAPRPV